MKKEWFVLHTLVGQENKAQKSIVARTKLEAMGDYIGECIIPTEKVTEKKNGKSRTITKKFFPGYVLASLHCTMRLKVSMPRVRRLFTSVHGSSSARLRE